MKDYLRLKHLLVFSLILISTLFACKNGQSDQQQSKTITDNELIGSILRDSLKLKETYTKVFYLTEKGCPTCNKLFSNFIQNSFSDEALYVIRANGSIIDISFFLDRPNKNIVFDDNNYFEHIKQLNESSVIYLKNNRIDTIVKINLDSLEEQFDYILSRD